MTRTAAGLCRCVVFVGLGVSLMACDTSPDEGDSSDPAKQESSEASTATGDKAGEEVETGDAGGGDDHSSSTDSGDSAADDSETGEGSETDVGPNACEQLNEVAENLGMVCDKSVGDPIEECTAGWEAYSKCALACFDGVGCSDEAITELVQCVGRCDRPD